jgi:carboxymethylenebutenolidase
MKFITAFLLCAICALAPAQEWAKERLSKSPRHGEWVTVQNGSRSVKAFVVYPEIKDKAPVVIVIHEIFGMTDWVQGVADQFAEAGYIAIAPDLLSGMGPNGGRTDSFESSKVGEAIQSLPPDQITGDLNAVAAYAKSIPAANGALAVAGFCWGGTQSYRYATNNPDLNAAFVFYGSAPTDEAALARIKAPVYGFYGENDNRINATLPKTGEMMGKAGKFFESVIYPGAGHGFMRAGEMPGANEDNKAARDKAWARILTEMKKLKAQTEH